MVIRPYLYEVAKNLKSNRSQADITKMKIQGADYMKTNTTQ